MPGRIVVAFMLFAVVLAACGKGEAPPKPGNALQEDPSLGLHPPAFITSEPVGAKVTVNGELRGKAPLETPLNAGEKNELEVELDGYFPETRSASPNARERLNFNFTLRPAVRLNVKTEPEGARVLVGHQEVLARTPGLSAPLEAGRSEVLVLLAGHQARTQTLELTMGDVDLELKLERGVKLAVTSTPDQAEVFVDGSWLGVTPLDVYVSPKGKHTVELKKEPYAPLKKVFASVKKPTAFAAKLIDTERLAAQQAVARARARYDKTNDALEKLQTKLEHMLNPTAKLERQLTQLEKDMEKAAGALEEAEAALKEVEQARGPAPKPKDEEDLDD